MDKISFQMAFRPNFYAKQRIIKSINNHGEPRVLEDFNNTVKSLEKNPIDIFVKTKNQYDTDSPLIFTIGKKEIKERWFETPFSTFLRAVEFANKIVSN